MPFHFKKFSIEDDRSTMKVGTDGVLLGSWVDVPGARKILDIGTGCGIIALILAQRSNAMIDGIDIDAGSIEQAVENAENSPWPDRLRFMLSSLQDYSKLSNEKYDLIVTNPPYFSNSLKSPSTKKNIARHAGKKEHVEWISHIQRLMKPPGKLALILPPNEWPEFELKAMDTGLYCHRKLIVSTKTGKSESRVLSEWGIASSDCIEESWSIMNEAGAYTEDYIQLTKEFYLDF